MTVTSLPDDFIQAVKNSGEFFFGSSGNALADSLDRQRSDLADLDPGTFGQAGGLTFERERKGSPGFLAGQRDCNHRSRTLVKYVVTEDEYRASARLLMTLNVVEVSPTDLPS